jgi:hypothetical protein
MLPSAIQDFYTTHPSDGTTIHENNYTKRFNVILVWIKPNILHSIDIKKKNSEMNNWLREAHIAQPQESDINRVYCLVLLITYD